MAENRPEWKGIHTLVYGGVAMSRTNIEIDDRLIETAMRIHGLKTKREAVDFALSKLVGKPMTREEMLAMQGTGWEGDLDALRGRDPWQA